jgi:hypothetical protein
MLAERHRLNCLDGGAFTVAEARIALQVPDLF